MMTMTSKTCAFARAREIVVPVRTRCAFAWTFVTMFK